MTQAGFLQKIIVFLTGVWIEKQVSPFSVSPRHILTWNLKTLPKMLSSLMMTILPNVFMHTRCQHRAWLDAHKADELGGKIGLLHPSSTIAPQWKVFFRPIKWNWIIFRHTKLCRCTLVCTVVGKCCCVRRSHWYKWVFLPSPPLYRTYFVINYFNIGTKIGA